MKKYGEIKRFIRENALQFTMQAFSLVFLILSMYLTTRIAPLQQDIAVIREKIFAIESNQQNFVQQKEFDQVITRLDYLTSRVDYIIQQLIR